MTPLSSALFFFCVLSVTLAASAGAVQLKASDSSQCSAGQFFACRDCTTQLVCDGAVALGIAASPATSPFCVDGRCSAIQSEQCKKPFFCSGSGYFPDPTDCQKYHVCSESGTTGVEFACPTGLFFNSKLLTCSQPTCDSKCEVVKCSSPGQFWSYPPNSEYYIFCDTQLHPQIYQCPSGSTFDDRTLSCQFVCTEEGNFAAGGSPTEYVMCSKDHSNGQYTSKIYSCPDNFIFNARFGFCKCTECNYW